MTLGGLLQVFRCCGEATVADRYELCCEEGRVFSLDKRAPARDYAPWLRPLNPPAEADSATNTSPAYGFFRTVSSTV